MPSLFYKFTSGLYYNNKFTNSVSFKKHAWANSVHPFEFFLFISCLLSNNSLIISIFRFLRAQLIASFPFLSTKSTLAFF